MPRSWLKRKDGVFLSILMAAAPGERIAPMLIPKIKICRANVLTLSLRAKRAAKVRARTKAGKIKERATVSRKVSLNRSHRPLSPAEKCALSG